MNLTGRTVLVTGASSGLGEAIAQGAARLGARVILAARDAARLESTCASLAGEGHVSEIIDLQDVDAVPRWMKEVAKRHGELHGVVHSAGIMMTAPVRILTAADWQRTLNINVVAGAALAKGFIQFGVGARGGSIVFLASVMGLTGQTAQAAYSATKGALVAMTRSMAMEFARDKIRVNCVAPAIVAAGMSQQLQVGMTLEAFSRIEAMHPLGFGRPEDVANAVCFLLADSGRWITGTTLVVDGGYTAQ